MRYKQPNKTSRFTLACIPRDDGFTYRLSRRDICQRLHFAQIVYIEGMDKMRFACALWALRKELRDRVDDIDLATMDVH